MRNRIIDMKYLTSDTGKKLSPAGLVSQDKLRKPLSCAVAELSVSFFFFFFFFD